MASLATQGGTMTKVAAVLLCLLPLAAAGKELKLNLTYQGSVDSALARADYGADARRELGHGLTWKTTADDFSKGHVKARNGRHGFGRLWADVVKFTHGSKPGRCRP